MLDQLVAAVDLYPTILQLAGIDYRTVQPDGIKVDGVSLSPYSTAPVPAPVHSYVYSDKFIGGWDDEWTRAVRNTTYKLIDRPADDDELFNLVIDPLELKNLLTQPLQPDAAAALAELRGDLSALLATRTFLIGCQITLIDQPWFAINATFTNSPPIGSSLVIGNVRQGDSREIVLW